MISPAPIINYSSYDIAQLLSDVNDSYTKSCTFGEFLVGDQ